MDHLVQTTRLLGLSGSLRNGSYSLAVLNALQKRLQTSVSMEICNLNMPLYNEDHDGLAAPEQVTAFRRSIIESDGIVIVMPEYNHGIPGVLKNALDWASRPFGKSSLTGKPVLAISISPAFTGGVRAQAQLNETLLAIQAVPVPAPQVVIGSIASKIEDGLFVDEPSANFALGAIDRLLDRCRVMPTAYV
ncbi:NADPH-dependent FMN reductase [Phyllobacterium trifolii]|nr:NAD(P)H-dependent oxidoreductase [Phyllobacterium trifolii]